MDRIGWRALGAGMTAALALAVVGVAAPAAAQPADQEAQDCVLWIDEDVLVCVPHGEDLDAAFTEQTGQVRVPSGTELDAGRDAAAPSAVYDLVTYYANTSYSGSNFTITRSTPCNGVTLSSVPNLGTYGLNDAVSSFFGWGSCEARLYADVNYGGSTYGYAPLASSLGAFDNVASSTRAR